MKALNYFNVQTFLALAISQLAAFLAIRYDLELGHNVLLYGIAVVFPLNFSIQSAFKRREKALEFLSRFKAGLMAVHFSFQVSAKLPDDKKTEARTMLKGLFSTLVSQLEEHKPGYATMQLQLNQVMAFAEKNAEEISKRNVLRVIRYLKDVTQGSAYLISLVRHRTMHGMRFYATLFILLFPFIQAPLVNHIFGSHLPEWSLYLVCALGSLILITLDNFQKMIEYPFNKRGMDNVQLHDFSMDI